MDVSEAIDSRLEVREYADRPVDDELKRTILEAGRNAPSGKNLQHWRFVLVDDDEQLAGLAERSTTGSWVGGADFAIAVCTDPSYAYHEIDAGRAITHMQLVAWEQGIGSCIYTVKEPPAVELLGVPDDYYLALVAGFGYPTREVAGHKDRRPLGEVAFRNRFGEPLDLSG